MINLTSLKTFSALTISAAVATFGIASTVQAGTFELTTTNQGWWSDLSGNESSNSNYITGQLGSTGFRNFFSFDLSALPAGEIITTAVLKLERATGAGSPTHTLGLFDVSTSAATLSQKNNNPNLAIYTDLGTGKNYGSYSVSTSGNSSEILSFALNSGGIADLNNSIGSFFSIGGALTNSLGSGDQYLFGFSGNLANLTVETAPITTIPTPALLPGLIGLGVGVVRKRKAKMIEKGNAEV